MGQRVFQKLSKIMGCTVGLVAVGVLFVWCLTQTEWEIREQLKIVSPLFLEFIMIGIVSTIGVIFVTFFRHHTLKEVLFLCSGRTATALLVIIAIAWCMLVMVVPRDHRIYYDEDIYENVAQNIAMTKGAHLLHDDLFSKFWSGFHTRFIGSAGMCNDGRNHYGEYTCYRLEYNKEPNGWPHLLSIMYRIAGVNEQVSFLTTNIVFLFGIVVVYWIGTLMFRNNTVGLYAALLFSLTPEVLIWSNTVAAEPGAAALAAASVLTALLFIRFRKTILLLACVLISAYAIQFRPESIMICIVIGLLIFLEAPDELKNVRLWGMVSLFIALIVPHLAHLFAVRSLGWGASGPKFSFSYFTENFRVNTLFYLLNMRFPLLYTLLFFIGLLFRDPSPGHTYWRSRLAIFVWFLLFWGIFLFFYAGSYNYGADVRFSVLSAIPLALLGGNGAKILGEMLNRWIQSRTGHCITTLLIVTMFLSFIPFIRAISQEAWAARADHRYAFQMLQFIPDNAVVLTHNPNMFLIWGKNAAQASLATEQKAYFSGFFNRYPGGVYFHYNFWCNVNDPLQNSFCKNILAWYNCTRVVTFKEQDQEFVLYKVERKVP